QFILPALYRLQTQEALGDQHVVYVADGVSPQESLSHFAWGNPRRVALEETMRASHLLLLLPYLRNAELLEAQTVLRALRMYKEPQEIDAVKAASEIVDAAAGEILSHLTPGVTERNTAFLLEQLCKENGAEELSFSANVSFGASAAEPHHRPGEQALMKNTFVLMDFGAKRDGYCSDITRTVCFGRATEEMRRVYDTVLAANRAAFASVRPGLRCEEIDRAARKVICDAGYGDFFIHRTGHGLGLDVHEEPYIVEGNECLLEEGMIFSIEPGIYLPGRVGVRIEDLVVVTAHGARCLNDRTRELMELA
ncbi:MAG: M24 family metallopeptidase, partial [Oscillospiraceae bacterium]